MCTTRLKSSIAIRGGDVDEMDSMDGVDGMDLVDGRSVSGWIVFSAEGARYLGGIAVLAIPCILKRVAGAYIRGYRLGLSRAVSSVV